MSDLVIKVKYGNTLRRYSVDAKEDASVDLNMALLRVKILSLFKFSPDADLSLTYIDEDEDVVTLVDDDDLRDAIKQCLNPLRINVLLNSTRAGRYDTRSSGSSTPMRSPLIQGPSFSHVNSGVTEVLKSVPEPFRDALSKLSYDLAAKAASSAPVLTELVESLSKLGLNPINSVSQCNDGAISTTEGGASENPVGFEVTEGPESSKESVHLQYVNAANTTSADDKKVSDSCNVNRGVGTSAPKTKTATSVVDLNQYPRDSIAPIFSATGFKVPTAFGHNDISVNEKDIQKGCNVDLIGNSVASRTSFCTPGHLMNIGPHQSQASNTAKLPFSAISTQRGTSVVGGDSNKQIPTDFEHPPISQDGFNPQSKCPFSGLAVVDSYDDMPSGGSHRFHPSKRSYNHSDSMGRIFHKGVGCDGCGVHPITGPRFKSKVKENYDLCSICYSEMGNEAEYIRLDRPIPFRPGRLRGFFHRCPTTSQPPMLQGGGVKPHRTKFENRFISLRPKFDSCFVQDVNVIDGTMMTPGTPFTKIWRMRNNGTMVWLPSTQLVWIGGDKFTDKVSVELEVPDDGFPVDKEIDIAVDFRAPQNPGRYVSYWRMATPSGLEFGQRVWVLIQVDSSLEDSIASSLHGLNLNLPPESNVAKGPGIIDMNIEPADSSHQESGRFNMGKELVKPFVDNHPSKDRALEFPVNDSLLVGSGVSGPVNPEVPASISYPIIDLSEGPSEPSPVMDMDTSAEETYTNVVEKTLLKELEEMGFKQSDLNKEILRKNEYNLQQSVDDLCDVAEWDPILVELQEMGFCDKETNKKLLLKNGGSIKQVVLDLIAGEKKRA
ncbi:protein JOKA2-like [Macadamia integrifolia]|uniref:protein JOKA2-like n=1 Tax=Macadamia integrifolia TaxID=60698 RepID=UPI001C4ECF3E|nr:protein JOKA2-like [Macadamia integrifolia]